jgi:hypothetical protein
MTTRTYTAFLFNSFNKFPLKNNAKKKHLKVIYYDSAAQDQIRRAQGFGAKEQQAHRTRTRGQHATQEKQCHADRHRSTGDQSAHSRFRWKHEQAGRDGEGVASGLKAHREVLARRLMCGEYGRIRRARRNGASGLDARGNRSLRPQSKVFVLNKGIGCHGQDRGSPVAWQFA